MTPATAGSHGVDLPRGVQGSADANFACAVRALSALFPHPRLGGGALAVYLDGKPVVDVWTGFADRRGRRPWTADTAPMVFSATKGVASVVIHRLADRGLIDYDTPVAKYWPAFGANGKADITVRDVMRHRAGLSHLHGVRKRELLDYRHMEERVAAAPPGRHFGKSAYHALTYGWLLSGLARSVTGKGMRELMRTEVAAPLNTDGVHLGRPPVGSPTKVARFVGSEMRIITPVFDVVAPAFAAFELSAAFGAMYFPGAKRVVQRDIPFLDTELPSANGVMTARALARMYGAIANGGVIDGQRYLSPDRVAMLTGRRDLRPDRNLIIPLAFHLGFHSMPIPGVLPGFGHVGLCGSFGWAIPEEGLSISLVHNRLLTPFVVSDQAGFIGTANLVRRGAATARKRGFKPVVEYGAPFESPLAGAVAG